MKNVVLITKRNCPFCKKAKNLLREKGIEFTAKQVDSIKEAISFIGDYATIPADHRTVPMVFIDKKFIGGYDNLRDHLRENEPREFERKTIFNSDSTGHLTGDYPLFLGESLGFADTINNPYPQLEKFFQTQQAFHWNEFEVDLTQDRQDMITAPKGVVGLLVKNILWQSLVDSVAARSISGVLMDMVSNPTLEGLYNAIAYFETIHSRTYLHIIKQTFVDPNESLAQGYADQDIMGRSEVLRRAFDDLLNLTYSTPIRVKRKALYKALITMYMLESLNFMASFAITFGIADAGYFQGIAQDVALICRDEMLHAKVGKFILEVEMNEHPDVFAEIQAETDEIFYEILAREQAWTDILFSEGRGVKNINAERIKKYVMYAAVPVAETLRVKDFTGPTENPLPYMDEYTNSSNVQVAPQELQLSAYLVNSVKAISNKQNLLNVLKSLEEEAYA